MHWCGEGKHSHPLLRWLQQGLVQAMPRLDSPHPLLPRGETKTHLHVAYDLVGIECDTLRVNPKLPSLNLALDDLRRWYCHWHVHWVVRRPAQHQVNVAAFLVGASNHGLRCRHPDRRGVENRLNGPSHLAWGTAAGTRSNVSTEHGCLSHVQIRMSICICIP